MFTRRSAASMFACCLPPDEGAVDVVAVFALASFRSSMVTQLQCKVENHAQISLVCIKFANQSSIVLACLLLLDHCNRYYDLICQCYT